MLCTFDDTDVVWMRGADEPLDFPLNLDVRKQLDGRVDGWSFSIFKMM